MMLKTKNWLSRHWKQILALFLLASVSVGGIYAITLFNKANSTVATITNSGTVVDLLTSEALGGEDVGVSNILIAGNSSDDVGHGGATLTDSIMVASINTATNKMTLISIPRDFWVSVDGYGSMKINAVYTIGGMDLLQSTVEEILGITINHQVLINYAAFQQAIDAVGGIDITIESSDSRGIYDPNMNLILTNGTQHLDGATALKLARSRNVPTYDGRVAYGLPNGDFDRILYQRKIAMALMAKISASTILTNQTKLISLMDSLSGNVTTNLSASQLRRLYDLSKILTNTSSISIRGEEGNYLLSDYYSSNGQSALIPSIGAGIYTDIQTYICSYLNPVTEVSND